MGSCDLSLDQHWFLIAWSRHSPAMMMYICTQVLPDSFYGFSSLAALSHSMSKCQNSLGSAALLGNVLQGNITLVCSCTGYEQLSGPDIGWNSLPQLRLLQPNGDHKFTWEWLVYQYCYIHTHLPQQWTIISATATVAMFVYCVHYGTTESHQLSNIHVTVELDQVIIYQSSYDVTFDVCAPQRNRCYKPFIICSE